MIFTKDYRNSLLRKFFKLDAKIHLSFIIIFEQGQAHCICWDLTRGNTGKNIAYIYPPALLSTIMDCDYCNYGGI